MKTLIPKGNLEEKKPLKKRRPLNDSKNSKKKSKEIDKAESLSQLREVAFQRGIIDKPLIVKLFLKGYSSEHIAGVVSKKGRICSAKMVQRTIEEAQSLWVEKQTESAEMVSSTIIKTIDEVASAAWRLITNPETGEIRDTYEAEDFDESENPPDRKQRIPVSPKDIKEFLAVVLKCQTEKSRIYDVASVMSKKGNKHPLQALMDAIENSERNSIFKFEDNGDTDESD